ncbi:MAG TPA: hypothetical protein VLA11_08555 [Woeseiaceae bacterium]|nr:hypothetical protein [Woeseiaceae bacterium]
MAGTLESTGRRAAFLAAIVAVTTLLAASARAADELDMQAELSPFSLRLGVYDMNLSTEVRVDGRGGNIGTRLDFEDDLNLDDNKDTFDAALRWRFKERHFLELEYFRLDRRGFRRLDGEIRFGEDVFPIGADIRSSFTTEVTRLGYSYRIVRNRDWGLAVGAGLHVTRLRAALTEVAFDNIDVPIGVTEIAKVTAPLPVIGFGGARRLGTKWALLARAQVFAVEIDDIDGTITHGALYFEHDTFDRFGFGFGYDWFVVDVKTEEDLWRGRAKVRFDGPMLFLKGSF